MTITGDVSSTLASTPVRCSPWTRAEKVDPIGSATVHDRYVLVEWPLPWPPDVGDIAELDPLVALGKATRVEVVVPTSPILSGHLFVTVWDRQTANRLAGTDHVVDADGLAAFAEQLAASPAADLLTSTGEAPADLLICSHGKRDACCGKMGTSLHRAVSARWDGVRVRRVSHLGGHRYAPTALSLPDGRMWAFVDDQVLDRVVRRAGDVAGLHDHQRGSSALDPRAQVVERALFERYGWAWLDRDLTEVTVAENGTGTDVRLGWSEVDGTEVMATAVVEVARELPVPDCGAPIEAAKKVSPEYRLARFELSAG